MLLACAPPLGLLLLMLVMGLSVINSAAWLVGSLVYWIGGALWPRTPLEPSRVYPGA